MITAYKNATHCYYCELPFSKHVIKTKDHIIPKSAGGSNDPKNIVPACRFCNCKKQSKTLDDFFNHIFRTPFVKLGGRDGDIVLQNIARLKSLVLRGEVGAVNNKKYKEQGKVNATIKTYENKSTTVYVPSFKQVARCKNEEDIKRLLLKNIPAFDDSNFHEDYIYNGICL